MIKYSFVFHPPIPPHLPLPLHEGQRLASRMCDEYRKTTIFSKPIEVTPENCTNEVNPDVGGQEARHSEFPHHALLGYNVSGRKKGYDFLCGRSLISDLQIVYILRFASYLSGMSLGPGVSKHHHLHLHLRLGLARMDYENNENYANVRELFPAVSRTEDTTSQRLASRMCDEYRRITIIKQTLIPLTLFPTPIEFESNNCTNLVQLIVGGEQAKYGEFPHHALLGYPNLERKGDFTFLCGGSLISDQHVLTAAHCFSHEDPEVVRLGEYDTKSSTGEEYDVGIAAIRRHPDYKNTRAYHDIALVKLANRIYFSKLIRPACLWDTEYRNVSKYIATGFGYNATLSGILSTTMMKVQLDEFPVEECSETFKKDRRFRGGVQNGQLCIGSIVEGRDTCQGDSGGPLQTVTSPQSCMYHVVGITSTGGACGIANSKAIYTKVSYYIQWIEDNVWGHNAM